MLIYVALLVSSSKAADNFVFLKVTYFINIVNLKDGQLVLLITHTQMG